MAETAALDDMIVASQYFDIAQLQQLESSRETCREILEVLRTDDHDESAWQDTLTTIARLSLSGRTSRPIFDFLDVSVKDLAPMMGGPWPLSAFHGYPHAKRLRKDLSILQNCVQRLYALKRVNTKFGISVYLCESQKLAIVHAEASILINALK